MTVVKSFIKTPKEWGKTINGGDYIYWADILQTDSGYTVRFECSSEFEFCDRCGQFGTHNCDPLTFNTVEEAEEYIMSVRNFIEIDKTNYDEKRN